MFCLDMCIYGLSVEMLYTVWKKNDNKKDMVWYQFKNHAPFVNVLVDHRLWETLLARITVVCLAETK